MSLPSTIRSRDSSAPASRVEAQRHTGDAQIGDDAGRMWVLEANPNPNLAYGEDFAESAEVNGLSYEKLLERIITLGLRWEPERTG